MFIVLLKFSENKAMAGEYMSGHNEWIRQGMEEGIFLVVGSLQPKMGGAVIAHGVSRQALEARVEQDPFVAEKVVEVEIMEISPAKADERLSFLLD